MTPNSNVRALMRKPSMLSPLHILAGVAVCGFCVAAEPVAISIFPTHYTVANERFTDPKVAVSRAAARSPDRLRLRMCATVLHKRVVEVTSLLQQEFKGQLTVSSINAGTGECPNFSLQSDARQETGARR